MITINIYSPKNWRILSDKEWFYLYMKNVNIHEATEKTSAALPINCRESILPCKTFHEFVTIIDMSLNFFFYFIYIRSANTNLAPWFVYTPLEGGLWGILDLSPLCSVSTLSAFSYPLTQPFQNLSPWIHECHSCFSEDHLRMLI